MGKLTFVIETRLERLERRDSEIVKLYKRLSEEKYNGKSVYRHEAIVASVAYEFYLSVTYANEILNGNHDYKTHPNDTKIDNAD